MKRLQIKRLPWKDERKMIQSDVEIHIEWHRRALFNEWHKELPLSDFIHEALKSRGYVGRLADFPQYLSEDTGTVQFGYSNCTFNIYDNLKSLAVFHKNLRRPYYGS